MSTPVFDDTGLNVLKETLRIKQKEVEALEAGISAIYSERRKTCTHPNEDSTPYERWCPDCGWHKDRSF